MSYRHGGSHEADFHSSARRNSQVRRENGVDMAPSSRYYAAERDPAPEQHYSQRKEAMVHSFNAAHQCEQLADALRQRMAAADDTMRAIRAAQDVLDTQGAMQRAKSEAEAWTHGKSKLASLKAAQNLSPLGVRAVVAERDELRYQLRKASSLLAKINGNSQIGHDLGSVFQHDVELLAGLKSAIELEQQNLLSRIAVLESQAQGTASSRRQAGLQISTLEEQLAEKGETILKLHNELAGLKKSFEGFRREADARLREELTAQRKRIIAQSEDTRTHAVQELEAQMRHEKMQELDDQRRQLQSHYEQLLESKLAEQHHALSHQLNADKVEEMKTLQDDIQHQHQHDMQGLRRDLIADKERSIKGLRRQHDSVVSRLESEIEKQHREMRAEKTRALEDQQRELMAKAEDDMSSALHRQKTKLKSAHQAEMQDLRQQVEDTCNRVAQATLEKELANLRKKLQNQHKRDLHVAQNNLRKELSDQHKIAMDEMKASVSRRKEAEFKRKLEEEEKKHRRQASTDSTRKHALAEERMQEAFKREKADALQAQEAKLTRKHNTEMEKLREKLIEAQAKAGEALSRMRQAEGQQMHDAQGAKRSRLVLKDRLRNLLSALKKHAISASDSMLDVDAVYSTAENQITVLISCLGSNEYSRMGSLSIEASNAPLHTVDVLFSASDELATCLEHVHNELLSTQQQLQRDRVSIKKQVEEELKDIHAADLENLRTELDRQFEFELEQRIQATRQMYDGQLSRYRRDMESQLKVLEAQSAAQGKHVAFTLKERHDQEKAAMTTMLQGHLDATRRDDSERAALERQVLSLEKDLGETQNNLVSARKENDDLRKRVHDLRFGIGSSTPGSVTSATNSFGGVTSTKDTHTLALEHKQLVKEQLKLQQQISLLYSRTTSS